jgi:hypothetical protein
MEVRSNGEKDSENKAPILQYSVENNIIEV